MSADKLETRLRPWVALVGWLAAIVAGTWAVATVVSRASADEVEQLGNRVTAAETAQKSDHERIKTIDERVYFIFRQLGGKE